MPAPVQNKKTSGHLIRRFWQKLIGDIEITEPSQSNEKKEVTPPLATDNARKNYPARKRQNSPKNKRQNNNKVETTTETVQTETSDDAIPNSDHSEQAKKEVKIGAENKKRPAGQNRRRGANRRNPRNANYKKPAIDFSLDHENNDPPKIVIEQKTTEENTINPITPAVENIESPEKTIPEKLSE
jgi:hypothetical protein